MVKYNGWCSYTPEAEQRATHVVAEAIKKTYDVTLNTPQLVVGKWQVPTINIATGTYLFML